MNKQDYHALTQSMPNQISKAASLAGRGLRDFQKIQEWELRFPEDRVVGWLEVMGKSIPAQGTVRVSKGVPIGFSLEMVESNLSFLFAFPADFPLYRLVFDGCDKIANSDFSYLSGMSQLQELYLANCEQISNKVLVYLAGLNHLKILCLGACDKITGEGLAYLSGLDELHTLDLSGCENITDEGLYYLSSLSQLKTLYLGWCNQITDEGLDYLSGLPNLHYLSLCECDNITDLGLVKLSHIPCVEKPYPSLQTSFVELDIADMASPKVVINSLGQMDSKLSASGLDEETYRKAKPHFQKCFDAAIAADKSLKEIVQFLLKNLSPSIKPYLIRFLKESKS